MDAHFLFMLGVVLAYFRYYALSALDLRYQSNPYNFKKSNKVIHISEDHYKSCLKDSGKELRFFLLQSSYTLPAILFFVGLGGVGFVESLAASLVSSRTSSSLVEGVVFFCIIIVSALSIDFILDYHKVVKKHRKVSCGEVADRKSKFNSFKEYLSYVIISIVCISLMLCCFYALTYFFPLNWLWVLFFSIILMSVASNILVPLLKFMNLKLVPLTQDSEIRGLIEDMCDKVSFSFEDIYVVNKSTKSCHGNAYAVGLIKKRIIFDDTLIEALAPREVAAIFLHEIGHYKFKHLWWQMAVGWCMMITILMLLSRYVVLPEVPMSFGLSPSKEYITLLMYLLFYCIISPFTNVFFSFLRRRQEFQADDFSYKMLPGSYLADALVKIGVTLNRGLPFHHPLCSFMRHSHPTILERVIALRDKEHKGD